MGGENDNNKHLHFSFFIFLQKQNRRYVKVFHDFACTYRGESLATKNNPPPPKKKERKKASKNSEIHIDS